MRHLRTFWLWLNNLFPKFVWEELTHRECLQLNLDVAYRWEGLHVEWADGTGFILTARIKQQSLKDIH